MKKAFTLAEVLITLGIIGIVAAMTIPNLITKIQWITLKQQYKKSYSTISQAFKQIYYNTDTVFLCSYGTIETSATCIEYNENGTCKKWSGGSSNGGGGSECRQFWNEMEKVLRISHVCQNKAYEKGCIPEYKGIDGIYREKNKDKNLTEEEINKALAGQTFTKNELLNTYSAYVLQDGSIIMNAKYRAFLIDVNGKAKPNKWGYDIFQYMIRSDANGKFFADPFGPIEKGGKSGRQMLQ